MSEELQELYQQLRTLDRMRSKKSATSRPYALLSKQIARVMKKIQILRSGESLAKPSVGQPAGKHS